MEEFVGIAYLLTGGALTFFGVLLGGGIVKSMTKESEREADERAVHKKL